MVEDNARRLRRPRCKRIVLGVCSGLGRFFGLSAWWFRIAFLIALIPGGVPGIGAYLLCWLIIPAE